MDFIESLSRLRKEYVSAIYGAVIGLVIGILISQFPLNIILFLQISTLLLVAMTFIKTSSIRIPKLLGVKENSPKPKGKSIKKCPECGKPEIVRGGNRWIAHAKNCSKGRKKE